MPRPTPRASSGRRLAPKISTRIVTMTTSSGIPSEPIVRLLSRRPRRERRRTDRHGHSTIGCAASQHLLAGAVALTLGSVVGAAEPPQFGTSVQVVEVYASVTDSRGEPIRGLRQDQFTVREDRQPQVISTFVEGDFPLSVAVAVDRSWSMAGQGLALAQGGARTLVGEVPPPGPAKGVGPRGPNQTGGPPPA